METNIVERISTELLRAASCHQLVPYQRFHAFFRQNVTLASRYGLLDQVVALLGEKSNLDYGVLLTLDNGLPGADFFARFKRTRSAEYLAAMGNVVQEQSVRRKRLLAETERSRVFSYARQQKQGVSETA